MLTECKADVLCVSLSQSPSLSVSVFFQNFSWVRVKMLTYLFCSPLGIVSRYGNFNNSWFVDIFCFPQCSLSCQLKSLSYFLNRSLLTINIFNPKGVVFHSPLLNKYLLAQYLIIGKWLLLPWIVSANKLRKKTETQKSILS